jgi:hypothetical protein
MEMSASPGDASGSYYGWYSGVTQGSEIIGRARLVLSF